MAFLLDGNPLAVDVPFTVGDINYPANWLRLSTAQEKTALGITEVADAQTFDSRFYWSDGTAKTLTDTNEVEHEADIFKVSYVYKLSDDITATPSISVAEKIDNGSSSSSHETLYTIQFGYDLVDEIQRNHASSVKNEVPLL